MSLMAAVLLCLGCATGFDDVPNSDGTFTLSSRIDGRYHAVLAAIDDPWWEEVFFNDGIALADLPTATIDSDGDGVLEHYLLVDHPSACDPGGCLFLRFEATGPDSVTYLATERRPVIRSGASGERFVPFGDDVLYVSTWYGWIPGTIDGEPGFDWLDRNLPADVVAYNRGLGDVRVGSYDIDDDGHGEVFVFFEPFGWCHPDGCGGTIMDFGGHDDDGRELWSPIGWFRGSGSIPDDTLRLQVSDTAVDGHRTVTTGEECILWRDDAYTSLTWDEVGDGEIAEGCERPDP